MINNFTGGNKSARDKLNQLVASNNALTNIRGDNLIHVVSNGNGYSFTFDFQKLISLLPLKQNGTESGSYIVRVYCSKAAGSGNTIVCYTDNPYPITWSATVTYSAGAIVCIDKTEKVYIALLGSNLNQNPATATTYWQEITNYDDTVTYSDEQIVFGTDGMMYQSQTSANLNNLITDTDHWLPYGRYSAGTTYAQNDVVHDTDGLYYKSLLASNIGHTPQSSPTWWQAFPSITVTCKLYEEGENLQYCTPILASRDEMKVVYIDDLWRSLTTFSPVCGGEA